MSQRHSEYPRRPNDDYATPAWVASVIAPRLQQQARYLWDPAAGAGQLVRALSAEGFQVVATADNFLVKIALPDNRIDCIITNPPYGLGGRLACQFISHAIKLAPLVAMLLRVDFDSGKTRTHLFRDCPAFAGKVVLLDRIMSFPGNVGPSTNHAWFIWNRRHRGPATIGYAGKLDANHHCDQPPSGADPVLGHPPRRDLSPSLGRLATVNCYHGLLAEQKLGRALEAVSYDGTEVHHDVDRELRGIELETAAREIKRAVEKKFSNTVPIDAAIEIFCKLLEGEK
jgi:hypothetical protein